MIPRFPSLFNLDSPAHHETCDGLILGSSFAAVQLACGLASRGRKVLLAERRTYPGGAYTAAARYWFSDVQKKALVQALPLLSECFRPSRENGWCAVPNLLKIALEDSL